MASFAEEDRPHSSSESETLGSEAGSSVTYISDSESGVERIKEKVCDIQVRNNFLISNNKILASS